jgi:hypothetical protein
MLIGLLANNVSIALATHVGGLIDTAAARTLPPETGILPLSTLEGPTPSDPATPPFSPTLDFPPGFRPAHPFTLQADYSGTLPMPP